MARGNYRHFLKLFLRGESDALIVEVREQETDRLSGIVDRLSSDPAQSEFFWFDTVDGKSFAINLSLLQAVHLLWDPTPLPPDPTRYDGPIIIALRERKQTIETDTASPEQVYAFFTELDAGPEVIPFPSFEDEDGETLLVRASEIAYVMAPLHLIEEGRQILKEELEGSDPNAEDA
jgi:hypothetical protein